VIRPAFHANRITARNKSPTRQMLFSGTFTGGVRFERTQGPQRLRGKSKKF
jgi:hypothetical protein